MRRKIGLTIILSMLILVSGIPFIGAENVNVVILVSDNEADLAIANSLAEIIGINVAVTPWGVYDPNVIAEIMEYAPDKVIIIGGPIAVPKEYEQDLQDLSITYERWYGENRYETNLVVIKKLKEEFPDAFKRIKFAYIVNGNDIAAIEMLKLEEKWMKEKYSATYGDTIWIFTFPGLEDITDEILKELSSNLVSVTIISSKPKDEEGTIPKYLGVNTKKIEALLIKHGLAVTRGNYTGVKASGGYLYLGSSSVGLVIELAENKTELAEQTLDDLAIPQAQKLLELAKKELDMAKEAYDEGEYGKAYAFAIAAKSHAEIVIFLSTKELRNVFHLMPKFVLERELMRLEIKVKTMERLGVDVDEIKNLLEQAKAALQANDYETAHDLIERAKEKLREAFIEEKGRIKHLPSPAEEKRKEAEEKHGDKRGKP
jgi:putative cell wall-binding protein